MVIQANSIVPSSPYVPSPGDGVAKEENCYEADDGVNQGEGCHRIDSNSQSHLSAPFGEYCQVEDQN